MSITIVLLLGLLVGLPCTLLAAATVYQVRASRMPAADDGWYEEDAADFEEWETVLPGAQPVQTATGAPVVLSATTLPIGQAPPTSDLRSTAMDAAILELQQTVGELQGQLARQRGALHGLLSDRSGLEPEPPAQAVRMHTADPVEGLVAASAALVASVQQLRAEGLSERAIARRLHVGLEEVRLAGRLQERAS